MEKAGKTRLPTTLNYYGGGCERGRRKDQLAVDVEVGRKLFLLSQRNNKKIPQLKKEEDEGGLVGYDKEVGDNMDRIVPVGQGSTSPPSLDFNRGME